MNTSVATSERVDRFARPHTPCPLRATAADQRAGADQQPRGDRPEPVLRQVRGSNAQDECRRQQARKKAEAPSLFPDRLLNHLAENSADAGDAAVEQHQRRCAGADEHPARDGAHDLRRIHRITWAFA